MCKYQCIEHCSAEPNCIIDISGTHPKSYPDMCPLADSDHDYITWIAVEPKTPKTVERNDSALAELKDWFAHNSQHIDFKEQQKFETIFNKISSLPVGEHNNERVQSLCDNCENSDTCGLHEQVDALRCIQFKRLHGGTKPVS